MKMKKKYKVFSKQLYEWISNDPKGENKKGTYNCNLYLCIFT